MALIEYNIIQILKLGTPLRAVEIARKLGVERREINHRGSQARETKLTEK